MNCKEMKRITTDTPKGIVETIFNFAYEKGKKVFLTYADGKSDVDVCEYVSKLAKAKGFDFSPEDIMEEGLFEYYEEDFVVLYYLAVQAAELRSRLKMFEDKLENGTIIELPCKIGDTVYVICWENRITPRVREEIVEFIDVQICAEEKKCAITTEFSHHSPYEKEIFNKAIFFTKEEAEARLKELKENV